MERGSDEEKWCKDRHLENNTFGEQAREVRGLVETETRINGDIEEGDGGTSCFIEGEEVRVMVVRVKEGRIADWKGGVKDWMVVADGEMSGSENEGETGMVNGAR